MTTPAQPDQPATGPDAPATGEQTPEQTTTQQQPPKPLGRPNTQPEPKPSENAEPKKPATGEDGPDWKARAREWENRSKANKQQLEQYEQQLASLRKAMGLEGEDGEEDLPEHAQRKLSEAEKAREAAEAERDEIKAEVAYEKAVTRIARTANADADALLDSDSFRVAVGEELDRIADGDDFTDADLAKAIETVAKEFAKKPRFALTPAPPPRSGGEITGGPPAPTKQRPKSLTEAVSRQYLGGG